MDPWVGKFPWRRKGLSTSVFLPGEFHGQRSLRGYSPWDCKDSDMTERLTNPCIQFSSVAQLSPTLCNPVDCSMPGFPVCHHSQSLLKLMSIQSVMPSNQLIFCRPLPLLPSIFPSMRVFSNESVLPIRWPKYWSFSFSISPSYKCSGLISFRMDWLDLLAVQGSLTSLLQQHSLLAKLITKTISKVFIDQIFFLLSSILF